MLVGSLQSVRGPEFDKTYARQQEFAHAQAVAVEESFATEGADPNLRKAAQSALPSIRDHLKKAQQLRVDVGGILSPRVNVRRRAELASSHQREPFPVRSVQPVGLEALQ